MKHAQVLYDYFVRYGLDSSVGIATRYGLDGPDRILVWARFSAPLQTGPEAHSASCTMGTGSFPGVKEPGRGVDHPPSSSAAVKERVVLYLYSTSGLSWTLPILLNMYVADLMMIIQIVLDRFVKCLGIPGL